MKQFDLAVLSSKNAPFMRKRSRRWSIASRIGGMIPLSVQCSRPVVSLRASISWIQEMRRALGRQYP
ncbi:hypothetical protein A3E76_02785 [Candidatus Saccharibacteria bacterium RIFCSPHIGHO2_12_FULL_44_22]|nr:MAG: hypothetical protein A3E76_02785 [Candidatus Saccharibacteria bacterium RIFCSPHIGHO2_12_FULL_44_22]